MRLCVSDLPLQYCFVWIKTQTGLQFVCKLTLSYAQQVNSIADRKKKKKKREKEDNAINTSLSRPIWAKKIDNRQNMTSLVMSSQVLWGYQVGSEIFLLDHSSPQQSHSIMLVDCSLFSKYRSHTLSGMEQSMGMMTYKLA